MSQKKSNPQLSQNMSFYEHFDELRIRIMRCLGVFFIGFIGFYCVAEYLLEFLRQPLFDAMPEDQRRLYFTGLFENFMTHLKVSGYASAMLLSPFYFFQLWGFISPGLHQKEKKLVVPFVSAATLFFLGGAAFAYYVLFPVGFKYFLSYGASTDIPLLTIDSYYTTCLKLMLLFGLSFELPVLICLLGVLGVVDAELLRSQRRTAILMITVMAALFAPPDAISMLLLGVPLIFMYEGAIWVVHLLGVKKKRDLRETGVQDPLEDAELTSPTPENTPASSQHPWEGRSR